MNGADGDLVAAVRAFVDPGYRIVVLGDDNALARGDSNAAAIIRRVRGAGVTVYGYLAVAVTHIGSALTLDQAVGRLERWADLGAGGILLDCAGHDFGVSRARFAAVVGAAHALGLRVLVNAWNPHDVLSDDTPLRQGDGYLGENTVLSQGEWREPTDYQPKLMTMLSYKRSLGIELFETATAADDVDRQEATRRLLEILAPYEIDCL